MSRPIDADALIHELNNSHYPGAPYVDAGISIAIGKVCDAPTIEPEHKTGKWIPLQLSMVHPLYQCTCCFSNAPMVETGCLMDRHIEALLTDYCPHCGAKMENYGGDPG